MVVLAYLDHVGVALAGRGRATIERTPLKRDHLKDTIYVSLAPDCLILDP
jgi:hypothetical protein